MTNDLSTAFAGVSMGRVAAPLREQVIDTLTDAILNFRLVPGQRLVERELIEQLGVSRTTIREALRELASEGLVTVLPQRGAVVATSTVTDARDLYDSRGVLEALVVQRFVDNATDAQLDRLVTAQMELADVARSGVGIREILAKKDDFYRALFDGAGSPALRQLVEGVQQRVRLLCASSLSENGRSVAAADELKAVVDQVRLRDGSRAAELMIDHIRHASVATINSLRLDPVGDHV